MTVRSRLTPQKVLVIDDDTAWLRVISDFLRLKGYSVRAESRGRKTAEAALEFRPDCILLDFHMADMEADLVCRELRSDERLKATPVIIVSADPDEEVNAYAACQADNFLLKGPRLDRITAAMDSLLRRISWDSRDVESGDLRLESESHTLYRNSKPLCRLSAEQFQLLRLLLEKARSFVSERQISEALFEPGALEDTHDAVKMVVYRLRIKLGPQLGRRIKNKRNLGWIYLQPQAGRKSRPV